MTWRPRLRRFGIAFAIAGLVLSTVDVNPAGEIRGAYADDAAADVAASPDVSPEPSASPDASPQPDAQTTEAPKGPQGGDLTNLTFTATENLAAKLIEPADGGVADSLAAKVTVGTVRGAGVELRVNEKIVPFSRIGKRTVDNKTGETTYTYYGVDLRPGPNEIELAPLGAGGLRGGPTVHRVYGPGPVASLTLTASGPLRADGASADELRVVGRDAYGHHAAAGSTVRLVVVSGDAHLDPPHVAVAATAAAASPLPLASSSPDPRLPPTVRQTIEVRLGDDGTAAVPLLPGLTPGEVVIRGESDEARGDARFFLSPNLRKPFVNGLITGGTGAVPGIPNQPDGDPDGTNTRRGRIAVFGTGAVGKSLATFAYDTANTLQRTSAYGGAYNGDPDDKPYQVTGDASTRRDDALSRDHLFARLDSGRATAMWGEFRAVTGSGNGTIGAFDQLVDGMKLDLNGSTRRMTLFAARNDIGYDRRVFAPSGLALGIVLRSDIVVGSESVILATVDARTGAIIAQQPLGRGIDYTLEYATGQLRFIEVPLPFDEAFNPHQIIITYEFNAPGNAAKTIGGRAESAFGATHAVKLGVGYVNDTSGAGNVTLATQDLSGVITGGGWSIVHASSRGALLQTDGSLPVGTGGSAWRANYNRTTGNDRVALLFERTDAGYDDPFGGASTPGLLNERFTYAHKYDHAKGELSFDAGYQANTGYGGGGSNAQLDAALRLRRALGRRLTLNAGLERRVATQSNGGPATTTSIPLPGASATPTVVAYTPLPAESSTQASLGLDWRASSKLDVSAERLQTIGGTNTVQPTQTDAQINYELGKSGHAYLRERWSASPAASFASSTQGLTALTGGTHATEFGFSRNLSASTSIDTAYEIDHAANGGDVFATMGVREHYKIGRFGGDAFYQHGISVGAQSSGAGFNLYGLSFSYADAAQKFRASGSTQVRTGAGGGVSLTLGAIGAISPDLSLFSSIDDARTFGSSSSDERVGLAWRPSRSDNGVTLLQYERRDGTSSLDNTKSGVLSLEQVLRFGSRTEVAGRYAYKLDGDSYYAAHSSLVGLRVDQKVGARFDAGAEVRQSNVLGIDGAKATAFAAEGGYRLGNQTRLGFGYNFSGTADPSLATTPTHKGFYATLTTVVDRLFGWGKR
ncbi:MAG TPA: hypothetical protein VGN14_14895 [Candidatus Elarobacter sp.]|jgi:hypothetical protein